MSKTITIKVEPKNIHTGNISVDSSLNVKGQNRNYDWINDPGDIMLIIHGLYVIEVPAAEVAAAINKPGRSILKPFNSIKRGDSTYCIKMDDILKTCPSAEIIM